MGAGISTGAVGPPEPISAPGLGDDAALSLGAGAVAMSGAADGSGAATGAPESGLGAEGEGGSATFGTGSRPSGAGRTRRCPGVIRFSPRQPGSA